MSPFVGGNTGGKRSSSGSPPRRTVNAHAIGEHRRLYTAAPSTRSLTNTSCFQDVITTINKPYTLNISNPALQDQINQGHTTTSIGDRRSDRYYPRQRPSPHTSCAPFCAVVAQPAEQLSAGRAGSGFDSRPRHLDEPVSEQVSCCVSPFSRCQQANRLALSLGDRRSCL